ncbi:MAG: hypothetical protein JOY93_08910, partial [Acidobacteriales bacterium]|nr:hypothetical protein [Terriglobales bacterium]
MLSTQSKAWIGAAVALVLAQAVASLLLHPGFTLSAITDIEQCLLLLSGALAFLCNVTATRGRTRLFWALMMFGIALWLSYQMLWTYYEVVLRTDLPDIFVGDVVLFLHLV